MNDNERFDGLEKKLDKIADLLEVLISQNNNTQQDVIDHSDKEEPIVEVTTTVSPPEENIEQVSVEEDPVLDSVSKVELEEPKIEKPETEQKTVSPKQTQRVIKKIQKVSAQPEKESILQKSNSDLEFFLGKNVFVILASLLIFIGIIFFAKVLLPYFTEEIKFALMCLFSLGFTAFSYFLVQKKQNNLTISMLACGLGTIYITLLTGNLYFKFINDVLLYIALLFWTMIVYFCSKYRTILFNIIGQAGIFISLILSMIHPAIINNGRLFLYSMIFISVAEVLYEFLFRKTEHNYINLIAILLSLLFFIEPVFLPVNRSDGLFTLQGMFSSDKIGPFLVWLALFIYAFVKNILNNKNKQVLYSAFSLANIIVFVLAFSNLRNGSDSSIRTIDLLYLFFLLLIFVITEKAFFSSERSFILNILSAVTIIGTILLYHIIPSKVYVPCLILVLPLIYYHYNTKTTLPKWLLFSSIFIASVFNYYYMTRGGSFLFNHRFADIDTVFNFQTILYFVLSIAFTTFLLVYFSYTEKAFDFTADNKEPLRIFLYLAVILNSCALLYDLVLRVPSYTPWLLVALMVLFVLVQILFKYAFPVFDYNRKFSAQLSFFVYFIVNLIMSVVSISFTTSLYNHRFLYLIACVLLTTLFSLNTSIFLKNKNVYSAAYVGVKITVLIFIILRPFNVEPLVSVMLFLWAIACILIGHHFSQKYLRLYALILALLSAAKLILIDISYTSSLSRAFSFIICGLLCFLISFMYNTMEKSLKKNETDITEGNNPEE